MVPTDFKGESVSFVWLYGIDVTPTPQAFDLYMNDVKLGTFYSPLTNEITTWSMMGAMGTKLTFNKTMIDKHGDQMGFAVFTVPANNIRKGEPLQIKVDAVDNESPIWYMTFKLPLKQEIKVNQLAVVTKENNERKHTVRFNIIHLGDRWRTSLFAANQKKKQDWYPV